MIKRIIPVALLGFAAIANSSCSNKSEGFKTKDGLQYKIIKDVPGKNAELGDIVQANILFKVVGHGKENVVFDSKKDGGGKPVEMQLQMPGYRGDYNTGLAMMSPGDNAIF